MPSDEDPILPEITSGVQLGHALAIAERLLEQTERTSERRRIVRITETSVLGLVALVITGWVGLDQSAGWVRLISVSLVWLLLGVSLAAAIHLVLEIPLRKRSDRDARALVEVAGLVRELMPLVARHEKWNELQMDLFKARLSRFPIGPVGLR
jgi:hypothetical protein